MRSLSKRTKNISFLLVSLVVLGLLLIAYKYPSLETKIENPIIEYGVKAILIALALFAFIYSIKRGTSTLVLKNVLRKTAEKTGLILVRPEGIMSRLVAPLMCFFSLKGDYRGYRVSILPMASVYGPFWGKAMDYLTFGHTDLIIRVGPFDINHADARIEKYGNDYFIDLPSELEAMPYEFDNNCIGMSKNDLSLVVKYKCPRHSEDLIKMTDILINVADSMKTK